MVALGAGAAPVAAAALGAVRVALDDGRDEASVADCDRHKELRALQPAALCCTGHCPATQQHRAGLHTAQHPARSLQLGRAGAEGPVATG